MKILTFFFLNIANCYCNSQFYTIQKSTNVTDAFHQKYAIDEASKLSKFQCLAECNQNIACVSVTYSIDLDGVNNCFLYNSKVNAPDKMLSNGFILFQKELTATSTSTASTASTTSTTSSITTSSITTSSITTSSITTSSITTSSITTSSITTSSITTSSITTSSITTSSITTSSITTSSITTTVNIYYDSICTSNVDCNSFPALVCQASQCKCSSGFWSYVTQSCVSCPAGYSNYGNTYCYWVSSTGLSWSDSKQSCANLLASLLLVRNQAEFDLFQSQNTSNNYWVDAKYSASSNNFVWFDNSLLLSNSSWWITSNNQNNILDECVYWSSTSSPGKLNNANCNQTMNYLCYFRN